LPGMVFIPVIQPLSQRGVSSFQNSTLAVYITYASV
jgi:hypothetical protein